MSETSDPAIFYLMHYGRIYFDKDRGQGWSLIREGGLFVNVCSQCMRRETLLLNAAACAAVNFV